MFATLDRLRRLKSFGRTCGLFGWFAKYCASAHGCNRRCILQNDPIRMCSCPSYAIFSAQIYEVLQKVQNFAKSSVVVVWARHHIITLCRRKLQTFPRWGHTELRGERENRKENILYFLSISIYIISFNQYQYISRKPYYWYYEISPSWFRAEFKAWVSLNAFHFNSKDTAICTLNSPPSCTTHWTAFTTSFKLEFKSTFKFKFLHSSFQIFLSNLLRAPAICIHFYPAKI